MTTRLLTPTEEIYVDHDGILRITVTDCAEITLASATQELELIKSAFAHEPIRAALVDITKMRSISIGARRLFASIGPAAGYGNALALLTRSPVGTIVANLMLNFNTPAMPTRTFASEAAALEWLRGRLPGRAPAPRSPPSSRARSHDSDRYTLRIDHGILRCDFSKDTWISLDLARETIAQAKHLTGGMPLPVLVDAAAIRGMDGPARDYYASEETGAIATVFAIVVDGAASRVAGNLFLRLGKPLRPTQLFRSVDEASAWVAAMLRQPARTWDAGTERDNPSKLEILEALARFATRDFSKKARVREDEDADLADIAAGVNMLAEELESSLSKERLYQELQRTHARLKEAQAQLIQASKLASLGTLASSMCHEINNPLAIIKGFVAATLERSELSEEVRDPLQRTLVASDRIGWIVAHLGTFAGQETNECWRDLRIAEPIHNSLQFLEQALKDEGITVEVDDVREERVYGNPKQLESVFQNLLMNSREAFATVSRESKLIKLSVVSERTWVFVRYEDNAGGMPTWVREQVFDPFFTTKHHGSGVGTGLGMSTSYGIIDMHAGTMSVESSEGQGSVFSIALPAARRPDTARSLMSQAARKP